MYIIYLISYIKYLYITCIISPIISFMCHILFIIYIQYIYIYVYINISHLTCDLVQWGWFK
jgi:hypothetical protein